MLQREAFSKIWFLQLYFICVKYYSASDIGKRVGQEKHTIRQLQSVLYTKLLNNQNNLNNFKTMEMVFCRWGLTLRDGIRNEAIREQVGTGTPIIFEYKVKAYNSAVKIREWRIKAGKKVLTPLEWRRRRPGNLKYGVSSAMRERTSLERDLKINLFDWRLVIGV